MNMIYGVDVTKEVSPIMVRDAIVECFYEAHCAQVDLGAKDDGVDKVYCKQIVMKAFEEKGVDFNNPTKKSILITIPWLADFSKSFRDQSVIQKHLMEIQKLIDRLVDE
jgi:hypothetical protein